MSSPDPDKPMRHLPLRAWLRRYGDRARGPQGATYACAPTLEIEILRGSPITPVEMALAAAWEAEYTVQAPWCASGQAHIELVQIALTPRELADEEARAAHARKQGRPLV